ncbi:MAG: ribulokinase [Bacteroidales bacterium]
MDKYVIGLDYGTDSVRALLVNAANGEEVATSVFEYPRWKSGKYCDPSKNRFRQHPLDYVEGLEFTVRDVLAKSSPNVIKNVVAISIDTTGSTPVAVGKDGNPLALTPGFSENPNAMFVLWKDHTAVREASEINKLAKAWGGVDYTKFEGGIYSSEWFWAKLLHIIREDDEVANAAYSWVEHCDWIPALLTGNTSASTIVRSRTAAGHKAMWHEDFDGLPSEEFLVKLDSRLKGLRGRLFEKTFTCDVKAGNLSSEWSNRLGLSESVAVGVGSFDAHLGAIGAQIKPYYLSKVMGTSTCDMLIAPKNEVEGTLVRGICGQVDGSIVPEMLGFEAGQSAFGDIYAWFKKLLMWPVESIIANTSLLTETQREALIAEVADKMIAQLSVEAEKIPVGESAIVALDWMNGRRTPDANQQLKGVIAGLNLGSDAPRIFKSLVEATAFGAKAIVDRFVSEGIPIHGVIALGGVAKKSSFVMQTVADVLNMPILVARSEQACALGSAMAASVVAGLYPNFSEAQLNMGGGFEHEYKPNPANVLLYRQIYEQYCVLGEYFEDFYSKE